MANTSQLGNNRHAYLILAHHQPKLLQVLIDMIDDVRNDIFIHVDAKTDINMFADIHTQKSKLYFTHRVKVYWGDYSMVKAELIMFETAYRKGPYLYYHLLSGVDLPLKNQDYIHRLLDDIYRGEEFVRYVLPKSENDEILFRQRYYYLFTRWLNNNSVTGRRLERLRKKAVVLQKRMGVWRNEKIILFKGANWVSITNELCSLLLQKRKEIHKLYMFTLIPDESFIQTILYHSHLYQNLHKNGYMRLIDWKRGNGRSPYTWKDDDLDTLVSSDMLFARKFSEKDMELVYKIKAHVLGY